MLIKYTLDDGEEMAYVSFGMDSEDLYDADDGTVIESTLFWHIDGLYVDPDVRGMGIARRLMTSAIEYMRKTDPRYVIKVTACPRDDETELDELCEFFESLGFYPAEDALEAPWPVFEMY